MANNSNFYRTLAGSCRRMEQLVETAGQAGSQSGPFRPFALPGDKPHYAPDREYSVKHIFGDLTLDFDQKEVSGQVFTTLSPVNDGLSQITFDAGEMNVTAVRLADTNLQFRHENDRLYITFEQPLKAGEELTVAIEYNARPSRGLYFIAPEPQYPDKITHVWSQGQDTDNHFWLPCYDAPNQKATTELRVVVPEAFFALSNGALLETTHDPASKTKRYHWKQAIAHSSYLITLAAGPFVEISDQWQNVPVPYYVLPGREAEARVSLSNTPQMVEFFSDKIGVAYPYEKYASVCVQDFIFGGMENTTATTLTDYTLHNERAHQDFTSDPLLAHELAHQWFGDLLTCRDWSNGWLNEGFATYFEALWTEHHLGRDEFIHEMYGNAQTYLGEDSSRYRRPIVAYTFNQPIDLFDRHLYEKGSLVLHMLRYVLGEESWWKAINHYVTKHRGQNVITADLERAVEEATGRNLQFFFEQWVYKAGFPAFKITSEWDETTKTARFQVAQTQFIDHENPLFRLPIEIAFVMEDGQRELYRVQLEEKEQNFYFRLPSRPVFSSFDPSNWILKTMQWNRPKEALIAQLEKDTETFGRFQAASALGKMTGVEAVRALEKALKEDAHWTVRAEAAVALAVIRTNSAEQSLLNALPAEQHPKVRRTIASALGEFRDEAAATALTGLLSGDRTDLIEMAAAGALGRTRQPSAFAVLEKALERDSFNQVVRQGALSGLVALKDERAIPVALAWTEYGRPDQARFAAIGALGGLGKLVKDKEKEQIVERLKDLLEDKNWRARIAAIGAAQTLGDPALLPILQRKAESGEDGREVRRSREAIMAIRDTNAQDEEVRKLRDDLDKVLSENRELRDRLESLEQRVK